MIHRLIATLCMGLALMMGAPVQVAAQTPHRLMIYIPPPSELPATQAINMGAQTRVGFGGDTMSYASPSLLGLSRYIGIIDQKDGALNPVSIFQIDDRNMIVPKLQSCASNCDSTSLYGTTWGSPTPGDYTVTVGEFFDAARTSATGAPGSVITVHVLAGVAHVREMTSAANGCPVNCEITNPDGGAPTATATGAISNITITFTTNPGTLAAAEGVSGTGVTPGTKITGAITQWNGTTASATVNNPQTVSSRTLTLAPFSAFKNQLNTTLSTGTTLVAGDVVRGRTGHFNPSGAAYRIRPPAGGGAAITITSEAADNSLDGNQNPALSNGFKIGGVQIDGALSGASPIAYVWDHVAFYFNSATSPPTQFLNYTGGTGSGMTVSYAGFSVGPLATTPNTTNGWSARAGDSLLHSHFFHMGKAFTSTGIGGNTASFNIGEQLSNDFIDLGSCNNIANDNFAFNWIPTAGNHTDSIQHIAAASDPSCPFGEMQRNIMVRNSNPLIATGGDAQGTVFANNDQAVPAHNTGARLRNNLNLITESGSTYLTFQDGPDVQANTGLMVINSGVSGIGALPSLLTVPSATFTGSISGTTLTVVTSPSSAPIGIGQLVTGSGVSPNTVVVSQINGAPGRVGTYVVSQTQTVPQKTLTISKGGTGGTFARNVFNTYNLAGQQGTLTTAFETALATTAGAYQGAYPNYVAGNGIGLVNRAAVIAMFTPLRGGTAANTDGTYSGWLFPANDFGEVCWNDLSVWNAAAHCTPAT